MRRLFLFLVFAFFSSITAAKSTSFKANDGRFLVESCREVVSIYESKNKEKLLAAQMTSVSEAMRAGYCIGVVSQYLQQSERCTYGSKFRSGQWFLMAKDIAEVSFGSKASSDDLSASKLLQWVYCGD